MSDSKRPLSNRVVARLLPDRYLAAQLRRPTGRFGRWVMTRGLNKGNAQLIEATLAALELGEQDRFLDLGFGGGLSIQMASRATAGQLWGVDFSPDIVAEGFRYLSELIEAGQLNLLTGDVGDLPLRDGVVDVISTNNTVYFWPDVPLALAEFKRVLSPGGRLAIGYSGPERMKKLDNITRHGFTIFTVDEFEEQVRKAGFDPVRTIALDGTMTEGAFVTVARR